MKALMAVLLLSTGCASADGSNPKPGQASTSADLSVSAFGARGDGTTPDTDAIQAAVDALPRGGTLRFPSGTYVIEADKAIRLKDDVRLDLGDATLVARSVNGRQNRLFDIQGGRNIVISGGTLVGSRSGSPGLGIGIFASDAQDLLIENVRLREFYLDGILLTGNQGCDRITLRRVVSEHNRRTGLAIVHARDVTVEDSAFRDSQGQSPEAGVNCEPNAGENVRNVRFARTSFTGNAGTGLYVHRGMGIATADVAVEGGVIENNGYGVIVSAVSGFDITGTRIAGHTTKGKSGLVLGPETNRASIVSNTFDANIRGILTGGASAVEIRQNTMSGTGPGSGPSDADNGAGVDIRGPLPTPSSESSPLVVAGNTIRRFAGSGIIAHRLTRIRILDNVIQDTGRRGIHLRGTSNSEIRGNDISGTGLEAPGRYDAVELSEASNYNVIAATTIRQGAGMRNPIGIDRGCLGNEVVGTVVKPE